MQSQGRHRGGAVANVEVYLVISKRLEPTLALCVSPRIHRLGASPFHTTSASDRLIGQSHSRFSHPSADYQEAGHTTSLRNCDGVGFSVTVISAKGAPMTFSTQCSTPCQLNRPNEKTLEQERKMQYEAVVALRRMLDGKAGRSDELILFSAA